MTNPTAADRLSGWPRARLYRLIDADQQTMRDLCAELEQVKSGHAELVRACEVYVRDSYPPAHSFDMQRFLVMETALAKLQGSTKE